jgi:hypothetical protein
MKRAEKQGNVKHKKDLIPMEERDWDEGDTEPGNNFAVYINGKKWKVLPGPLGAYADSPEERRELNRLKDMAQRKSQQTGKKWEVYITGEKATEGVEEGWSDKYVAQRTGRPRTPYSVYIKGKKWKDFENDDHARAVMDKLKAKFKADGRDPETITIAPTDYDKMSESGLDKFNSPEQLKKDADYRAYRAGVKASRKQPPAPLPTKDIEEAQLDEAPARDVLLGLLDKFYADMKLPPRQGSLSGALDIKSPGTKVWTRGDGTRLREPGRIKASYWADDKKQAEKAATKFWPWLLKQPGVKSIGQVSGQFGSSPMTDAVSYKGLYFSGGPYGTEFGSMSRIKNPKSVWRHKPFELEPKAEQGVAEGESARDKWNKASAEREKKHNDIESKRQANAKQGKEDMKGSIDRLEKALNNK